MRPATIIRQANSAAVWRKAAGLRQADAAKLLGLPRYLLSNVETGTVTPAWEIAVAMSRIYACGVGDLFPGVAWQGEFPNVQEDRKEDTSD